jgi:hypothetical protein
MLMLLCPICFLSYVFYVWLPPLYYSDAFSCLFFLALFYGLLMVHRSFPSPIICFLCLIRVLASMSAVAAHGFHDSLLDDPCSLGSIQHACDSLIVVAQFS